MHQHAVFQVVAQAAGQHHFFYVTAKAHHVFDAVAVADANHILLDDGAGIQLFGHIVTGGANQFHATH
ncbi:hypothetical protein D9M71_463690 [compost metagenome]